MEKTMYERVIGKKEEELKIKDFENFNKKVYNELYRMNKFLDIWTCSELEDLDNSLSNLAYEVEDMAEKFENIVLCDIQKYVDELFDKVDEVFYMMDNLIKLSWEYR